MRFTIPALFSFLLLSTGLATAAEPLNVPRPLPVTRLEVKQLLEEMKTRTPRIPLPELTDADREALGERSTSYESRLRYHYSPGGNAPGAGRTGGGGGTFGFSREPDPKMTLDYAFKVELFWIVSRTNNCQYCLGHQESKLLGAGRKEDQIAALDGDWKEFKPSEQAAFGFARKLTYEPHRLTDADIEKLRPHFTDLQILEMVLSVAGNNAINRWKEGAGIPQSENGGGFSNRRPTDGAVIAEAAAPAPAKAAQTYLTPTAEKFQKSISKVAPLWLDPKTGEATRLTTFTRAPLESRAEAEQALAACAKRTARLPLVTEAAARELLPEDESKGALPQWVRLLANFPRDGKSRILSQRTAETTGDLTPLLKAQISWIIARQDRAWYAAGLAKQRLKALGQSDDQVFALDGDWSGFTPSERVQFRLASRLSATPVVLTDAEVAAAVKLAGPRDVTQLITYVTTCASFDRITEAAGLRLE